MPLNEKIIKAIYYLLLFGIILMGVFCYIYKPNDPLLPFLGPMVIAVSILVAGHLVQAEYKNLDDVCEKLDMILEELRKKKASE